MMQTIESPQGNSALKGNWKMNSGERHRLTWGSLFCEWDRDIRYAREFDGRRISYRDRWIWPWCEHRDVRRMWQYESDSRAVSWWGILSDRDAVLCRMFENSERSVDRQWHPKDRPATTTSDREKKTLCDTYGRIRIVMTGVRRMQDCLIEIHK